MFLYFALNDITCCIWAIYSGKRVKECLCFHHIPNWPIGIKFLGPMSGHLVWELLKAQAWRNVKIKHYFAMHSIKVLAFTVQKLLARLKCQTDLRNDNDRMTFPPPPFDLWGIKRIKWDPQYCTWVNNNYQFINGEWVIITFHFYFVDLLLYKKNGKVS